MTRRTLAVTGLLLALGIAGCGTATAPTAPASAAVSPAPAPAPTTALPTTAPAPAAAPSSWVMPNLVGANLQAAQDAIQALTGFGIALTTSSDATGAGRHQVLDRNWKVCSQNVAPGAVITSATRIDFGAVKLEERCG